MGEAISMKRRRDSVLFAGHGERGRPDIVRVEIRKGGQCRRRFDFRQTVQPLGEGLRNVLLRTNQSAQEPEIPWAKGIDHQMDERVGLDTDRMQGARGACELHRGADAADQRGPC